MKLILVVIVPGLFWLGLWAANTGILVSPLIRKIGT